ncbi:MAG: hypothetical protein P8Y70_20475 [Candidatus Lokiarchaeota archaeon]
MLIVGIGFSWTRIFYDIFEPFDLFIVLIIWNTIAFLIFYLGKKYIIAPRIGFVQFGVKRESRKKKLKIFLIVNVFFGILMFILTIIGSITPFLKMGFLTTLFIGFLFFSIPFAIIAYFLEFNRLYIYSFMFGFSFFLSELLYPIVGTPLDSIIPFAIPGAIIIIIGLIYFIKFIKKYPKPESIDKFTE